MQLPLGFLHLWHQLELLQLSFSHLLLLSTLELLSLQSSPSQQSPFAVFVLFWRLQAGLPSFGSFGREQLKEPTCFKILFWWLVVPLQQWHPVLPNTPRRWNTELIFIMLASRLWTWFIFVGVKLITEPVFTGPSAKLCFPLKEGKGM